MTRSRSRGLSVPLESINITLSSITHGKGKGKPIEIVEEEIGVNNNNNNNNNDNNTATTTTTSMDYDDLFSLESNGTIDHSLEGDNLIKTEPLEENWNQNEYENENEEVLVEDILLNGLIPSKQVESILEPDTSINDLVEGEESSLKEQDALDLNLDSISVLPSQPTSMNELESIPVSTLESTIKTHNISSESTLNLSPIVPNSIISNPIIITNLESPSSPSLESLTSLESTSTSIDLDKNTSNDANNNLIATNSQLGSPSDNTNYLSTSSTHINILPETLNIPIESELDFDSQKVMELSTVDTEREKEMVLLVEELLPPSVEEVLVAEELAEAEVVVNIVKDVEVPFDVSLGSTERLKLVVEEEEIPLDFLILESESQSNSTSLPLTTSETVQLPLNLQSESISISTSPSLAESNLVLNSELDFSNLTNLTSSSLPLSESMIPSSSPMPEELNERFKFDNNENVIEAVDLDSEIDFGKLVDESIVDLDQSGTEDEKEVEVEVMMNGVEEDVSMTSEADPVAVDEDAVVESITKVPGIVASVPPSSPDEGGDGSMFGTDGDDDDDDDDHIEEEKVEVVEVPVIDEASIEPDVAIVDVQMNGESNKEKEPIEEVILNPVSEVIELVVSTSTPTSSELNLNSISNSTELILNENLAPDLSLLKEAVASAVLPLAPFIAAAQSGSLSSLAKRSPPIPGILQMPVASSLGLGGISPKEVRKRFNGYKIVAVLALNVELIRIAEEFQGLKSFNQSEYEQLTRRLQANLAYLAAMADLSQRNDNARAPPPPPILDAPSTPYLGPKLSASYQQLKGYFQASEKFDRQNSVGYSRASSISSTSSAFAVKAPASISMTIPNQEIVVAPIPSVLEKPLVIPEENNVVDLPIEVVPSIQSVESSVSIPKISPPKRTREASIGAVGEIETPVMKKGKTTVSNSSAAPTLAARRFSGNIIGNDSVPSLLPMTIPPASVVIPSSVPPLAPFQTSSSSNRSTTPANPLFTTSQPQLQTPSVPIHQFAVPNAQPTIPTQFSTQVQPSPVNNYSQLSQQQQAMIRQRQVAGMAAQQQQTLMAQQHIAAQRQLQQQQQQQQQENEQVSARRTPSLSAMDRNPSSPGIKNSMLPSTNLPSRPLSAMGQSPLALGQSHQSSPSNNFSSNAAQYQQLATEAREAQESYASLQGIIAAPSFQQLHPDLQNQLQSNLQQQIPKLQAANAAIARLQVNGGMPVIANSQLQQQLQQQQQQQLASSPRGRAPSYNQSPQIQHSQLRQGSVTYGGSQTGSVTGSISGSPPPPGSSQGINPLDSSSGSFLREQLAQQQQQQQQQQNLMHAASPSLSHSQIPSPSPMMNYGQIQSQQQVGSPYTPQPSHQRVPSQPQALNYYQQQPQIGSVYPSSHSPAAFSIPSPAYTNLQPNSPYSAPPPPLARKFSQAESITQSTPGPSPILANLKAPKKPPKITKKAQRLLDAAEAEETARIQNQQILIQKQQQQAQAMSQQQQYQQGQPQTQLQAQLFQQQRQQRMMAEQAQGGVQGTAQAQAYAQSPGNPQQQVRVPSRGPGSTQQSIILQQQLLQQQAQERQRAQNFLTATPGQSKQYQGQPMPPQQQYSQQQAQHQLLMQQQQQQHLQQQVQQQQQQQQLQQQQQQQQQQQYPNYSQPSSLSLGQQNQYQPQLQQQQVQQQQQQAQLPQYQQNVIPRQQQSMQQQQSTIQQQQQMQQHQQQQMQQQQQQHQNQYQPQPQTQSQPQQQQQQQQPFSIAAQNSTNVGVPSPYLQPPSQGIAGNSEYAWNTSDATLGVGVDSQNVEEDWSMYLN